ncbi:phytosulfokines 3 [Cucumis sativus]|uniref:Phytosulfokine n=1 Tax=Cucumis sativus TaxID=3659 RepID=A0A0A0KY18_CUCSA|nr:phytosulfokines 3 [Cucumis sativus]
MASKLFTSIYPFLFLFLFFSSSSTTPIAARPVPGFSNAFLGTSRDGVVVEDDVLEEESCDEIGEEYCLMRKTLAAHVDYIYTDTQKP